MRVFTKDKADDDRNNNNNNKNKFSFEISGGSRASTPSSSPLRSLSPLLLISSRKSFSFSYGKLPLEPIRLTVLKLDGSSFDISVPKNPTVAQLKQGVQHAFNHFPKDGIAQVSWSHVWAQFCLCFNGQKLLSDQDNVAIHGIKDGDQLEFARHRSISYNLAKERPEKHERYLQESTSSTNKQEVQTRDTGDNLHENSNQQNQEDEVDNENNSDDIAVNITCYCSWAHLWKRLFTPPNKKRRDTNYAELA